MKVLYTCISFFHSLLNRTTNIQTWDACHVFLVVSLVLQPALQCPKQPTERNLHNRRTLSARQVTSDVENRIWRIPCHLEDMCIMLVSGHGLKNNFYYICSMLFSEPYLAFSWILHSTTTGMFDHILCLSRFNGLKDDVCYICSLLF